MTRTGTMKPILSRLEARAMILAGDAPDGLSVDGSLDFYCESMTTLPEDLTVGGNLFLHHCQSLKALPENLSVGGNLHLDGCKAIKELPDNLAVGGYISLCGCKSLTALPEGLTVGGLFLNGCTSLPALFEDDRHYSLVRVGDRYYAGCRNFSASEAVEHWGSPDYPDLERGAKYMEAVEVEEHRRDLLDE